MKCATCQNKFVIRTDPKNCDYDFVEGIRRKEQEYDAAVSCWGASVENIEWSRRGDHDKRVLLVYLQDIGLQELPTESSANAVQVDPLASLEKEKDDKRKANAAAEHMMRLMELKAQTDEDNYNVNAALRHRFREEKKAKAAVAAQSQQKGLIFDLLPADPKDDEAAAGMSFGKAREASRVKNSNAKFAKIMASSIFGSGAGTGSGPSSTVGKTFGGLREEVAVKRAKLGLKTRDFKVRLQEKLGREQGPVLLGKKRKAP